MISGAVIKGESEPLDQYLQQDQDVKNKRCTELLEPRSRSEAVRTGLAEPHGLPIGTISARSREQRGKTARDFPPGHSSLSV